MNNIIDYELDCTGLFCPLPLLKTIKALKKIKSGRILKVYSSDPDSMYDIPSWISKSRNKLIDHKELDGIFHFLIEKE